MGRLEGRFVHRARYFDSVLQGVLEMERNRTHYEKVQILWFLKLKDYEKSTQLLSVLDTFVLLRNIVNLIRKH